MCAFAGRSDGMRRPVSLPPPLQNSGRVLVAVGLCLLLAFAFAFGTANANANANGHYGFGLSSPHTPPRVSASASASASAVSDTPPTAPSLMEVGADVHSGTATATAELSRASALLTRVEERLGIAAVREQNPTLYACPACRKVSFDKSKTLVVPLFLPGNLSRELRDLERRADRMEAQVRSRLAPLASCASRSSGVVSFGAPLSFLWRER